MNGDQEALNKTMRDLLRQARNTLLAASVLADNDNQREIKKVIEKLEEIAA